MIARLTRYLLLFQATLACGFYFALHSSGLVRSAWLAAVLAIAVIALARMLITANNFWLARRYCSTPVHQQLNFWHGSRMFMKEFGASMLSSSWSMPFLCFDRRMVADASSLPVLLVHGYGCNSGYWHSMSRALIAARISHHALDLEPIGASIDDYAPQLQAAITRLCNESGHSQIIIVAHSMGGLAARAFLRAHGAKHVAGVITLGTPHHGTGLANFGLGENSKQMRWRGKCDDGQPSTWLTALAAQESAALRTRFVSIYSHHDNIISPQNSAHLEHAKNIGFPCIGHVTLALHPAIQACVVDEIRRIHDRG